MRSTLRWLLPWMSLPPRMIPPPTRRSQEVACKLGGGPALASGPSTNVVVRDLLCAAAERLGVGHQPAPSGRPGSNDSKPMQVSRGSVAVGSVGIPLRNMHTQAELCELKDIDAGVELLVEMIRSIDSDTDFRPLHHGGGHTANLG